MKIYFIYIVATEANLYLKLVKIYNDSFVNVHRIYELIQQTNVESRKRQCLLHQEINYYLHYIKNAFVKEEGLHTDENFVLLRLMDYLILIDVRMLSSDKSKNHYFLLYMHLREH